MFLGSYIVDDLRKINKSEILKKVKEANKFSISFIILIIGSSIVCTLGLLLNSTAIVIGGMIISPLMWPLMMTSLGISYGRPAYIRKSLILLLFAVILSLLSAYLITYLSPIKNVSEEILLRTNPTFLDIVIAIVAGGVAALAITQPKISESLAGVAIATSLTPPICVSGIGLALFSFNIFSGGLLLFFANAVSIIFISILIFLWIGLKNASEPSFQKRAIAVMFMVLVLTSIPLFVFLRQFSFETIAYNQAERVLSDNFSNISQSIYIANVKTSVQSDRNNNVLVEAEVLIPEDIVISFEERQNIKNDLEKALGKEVELRLRLQKTISILSKSDIEQDSKRQVIEKVFIEEIKEINTDVTVDTLEVFYNGDEEWNIEAVLRGDPSIIFTYTEQAKIKGKIEKIIKENVNINVEIISRIRVQTTTDELSLQIKQDVQQYLGSISSEIKINSLLVGLDENEEIVSIVMEIKVPNTVILPTNLVGLLNTRLNEQFSKLFITEINVINVQKLSIS